MEIKGKRFIVTGGGNGMGRQLVFILLSRQAKVVAVDVNQDLLNQTAAIANSKNLETYVLDITDKTAVETAVKKLTEQLPVDGLINNAGIVQPFCYINDLDYNVIDRVMNVDFFGTLYMTKAFLPHLLTRPEAYIANVSSMGGCYPVPMQGIYGTAKSAVKMLTESLIAELYDTFVHVSLICPGGIATNIKANSGVESSKAAPSKPNTKSGANPLSAEKAATIILDGIEKNKNSIYVGKDMKKMNLLHRISPSMVSNMLRKKMQAHIPAK